MSSWCNFLSRFKQIGCPGFVQCLRLSVFPCIVNIKYNKNDTFSNSFERRKGLKHYTALNIYIHRVNYSKHQKYLEYIDIYDVLKFEFNIYLVVS